jgi:KipI family sensor histidine kinase inhibitor
MTATQEERPPRFLPAGDTGLVVEFGDRIEPGLIAQVRALDRALSARPPAGVIETVPSFRSLLIHYDPLETDGAALMAAVNALSLAPETPETGRDWCLPVCFDPDLAPDLADVAAAIGISPEAVIAAHMETPLTVAMIGFMPGCPFLAGHGPAFDLPRRAAPRVRVPAGSLAVAQRLNVIYPAESPGGWHLIGHCPVPLFDPSRAAPALLAPGDRVRFQAIDRADHARILAAPARWNQP